MITPLKPYLNIGTIEAGCDEAGRGCLSGPVFAAAVILPSGFSHPLLNDSKQLSEKTRTLLKPIIEKSALAWAIGIVSNVEIDDINILNASILAMHRALDKLEKQPEFILVDGNRFKKYKNISHQCIVKGDSLFMSIAAASVLAKTHRDQYMETIDKEYPCYKWNKNKGYPTVDHRKAIADYGETTYHRKTFKLLPPPTQFEITF
jgi:ribonuclease HII